MSRAPSSFAHTPYDGSAQPFAIGLYPLDLRDWIEIDGNLSAHLSEKHRLMAADETAVFRAEPGTQAAQREVLELLLDHLARVHPETHSRTDETVMVGVETHRIADHADAPLKLASLLVQEDLVLMRRGPDGYRLAAASLCFPSSWSLAEKFGRAMPAIHEEVPGFNDGRMGAIVARIFDNLQVEKPVWRANWSLYGDADLHHPRPGSLAARAAAGKTDVHIRVERQTLRRLPVSGDILFTIRIHVDPMDGLATHPEAARLAEHLRAQLMGLDAAQLAYKGLAAGRDRIAARLAEITSGDARK